MTRRPTIEEVADRWQRRHTGPWRTRTIGPAVGGVQLTTRYRRRPKIENVRLAVAWRRFQREMARELAGLLRWLRLIR